MCQNFSESIRAPKYLIKRARVDFKFESDVIRNMLARALESCAEQRPRYILFNKNHASVILV